MPTMIDGEMFTTDENAKVCADCEFSESINMEKNRQRNKTGGRKKIYRRRQAMSEPREAVLVCNRTVSISRNIVTGEEIEISATCADERLQGECGPEGQFFQATT